MPTKPKPVDPDDLTDVEESLLDLYKIKMKDYAARDRDMQTACRMTYAIAYGQCSPTVRAKLKALPEFHMLASRSALYTAHNPSDRADAWRATLKCNLVDLSLESDL